MSEHSEVTSATYTIGQHVTMAWTGGARDGVVVGEEYADSLPTGARFVPVEWADGSRDNVDTRVLSVTTGSFAECPDCGSHLYLEIDGPECSWICLPPTGRRTCDHAPLADRDVYLEHDERHDGAPDDVRPELLALYVIRTDEPDFS